MFGILLWWYAERAKVGVVDLPVVTIRQVQRQTLPQNLKVAASFTPHREVLVRSRIDAQLKKIHFQEGQVVEAGALLFSLDDDLLQAQLKQAEAGFQKNTALVVQSEKELKRHQTLLKKGVATQSAVDLLYATMLGHKASVSADTAQVELLKLQVGYAQINSPLKGIAGFAQVKPGNIVRLAEDLTLVSVMELDPIDVIFEIPEKYLPQVLANGIATLKVNLVDVNQKPLKNSCKPVAMDQGVNPKSGVFSLKVTVENPQLQLRPGMSVSGNTDVLVVPSSAVLMGQNGSYVYVVDSKADGKADTKIQKVRRQMVKVRDSFDQTAIIETGLTEGESIVTAGQIRLKEGQAVRQPL